MSEMSGDQPNPISRRIRNCFQNSIPRLEINTSLLAFLFSTGWCDLPTLEQIPFERNPNLIRDFESLFPRQRAKNSGGRQVYWLIPLDELQITKINKVR